MKANSHLYRFAFLLTTVGGLGLSPWAPGTVGSLAPTLIVLLGRQNPDLGKGILWALIVATGLALPLIQIVLRSLALRASHPQSRPLPKKLIDPSFIVLDEVIGQLLTFALIGLIYPLSATAILLGFAAFRLFDILKPWPIRTLERTLERHPSLQALSVVVDDVLAGILAAGLVVGILHGHAPKGHLLGYLAST